VADVTSSARPLQILGHAAVANERSATVARRDGRTVSKLVVDDLSPAYQRHSTVPRRGSKVRCRAELSRESFLLTVNIYSTACS